MSHAFRSLLAASGLVASLALVPGASAQNARPEGAARPAASSIPHPIVETTLLEAGANSFTQGQVRRRLADAGLTNVQDLRKTENGIWTGRATRNGAPTEVALDFRGHIAAGAGVAAAAGAARATTATTRTDGTPGNPPGTAAGRAVDRTLGTSTTGANTTGSRPDGAPGNPPSTMTGRAVDRAQGETPRPDGTPGNPAGTAAGRAVDRTLGTNTTGANPGGSRPDGAPGNPPSTMTGRAVDRAQGEAPRPDGTPGNPAGTAAGRAMDRTLGTNTTGTNPAGTPPVR